jgi:hypothetical protein
MMFELMCALALGMFLGYLLKGDKKPPIATTLQNQVESYEKELKYYKNLCKWHVEQKEK